MIPVDSAVQDYVPTDEEVLEEVKGLPSSSKEHIREMAKNNLYFLSKGILNYPDVNPNTHLDLCTFAVAAPKLRRMMLMPRGHLKSTLLTIADSIRIVIQAPEFARILIASETVTQAISFLREIKGHWETNDMLRELFPELVPSRFAGQGVTWANNMAKLNRKSPEKEPHWMTVGVGGAVTGFHFTRIKCDDLIGLEASRSPAEMKSAKDWVDNIEPLVVDQNSSIIDFVGTRWGMNDLYHHVMESYGDTMQVFLREAIEDGKIIFPQKQNWERYKQLQERSPRVWYSQYCNNPIASGQQDFPIGLVRSYRFSVDGSEVIFTPPVGDQTGEEKRWKLSQLDRVISCDPNSGSPTAEDTAAIIVSGISPDDEVFVLHTWSDRKSPSEFVDKIFELAKFWRPRVIGIEKAGQQNTEHYFRLKMDKESEYFNVVPTTPKNKAKEDRVRGRLEPVINSGRLYMLPSQTVLRGQIATHPDCLLFDEIDAFAYAAELWRRPVRQEDLETNRKVIKMLQRRRSHRTGY